MGRKASHRISKPHPSPRFRDKVRLLNYVRGPDDEGWHAQFLIDGVWTPRNPVSLSTKDWDEACENARDRYTLVASGQPPAPPRVSQVKDTFRQYAELAIADLRHQAEDADEAVKGKGHKFRDLARRIADDLLPKWGDTPIASITDHALNDWIKDEYRVEDRDATVAAYGRQPRGAERKVIYKKPAMTTLGNLDWAFAHVWDQAAQAKAVDRRQRPVIDKTEHGEDGEPRPFIDADGVAKVHRVMTDAWVVDGKGHTPEYKILLRGYLATAASTGIRPGLELKRVRIGNVQFRRQEGHDVALIYVEKNAGKHKRARNVVVYEGGVFPIRQYLQDLIAHRRHQGATDTDYLFAWADNSFPSFHPGVRDVLEAAGCLLDPMTGEERVSYSFRHFFATSLIERGLSVMQVADWLGTSSDMVERHYDRFLTERNAHLVNGAELRWQRAIAIDIPADHLRADLPAEEQVHPTDEEPDRGWEYDPIAGEWIIAA